LTRREGACQPFILSLDSFYGKTKEAALEKKYHFEPADATVV
jgi:hypothetical protein